MDPDPLLVDGGSTYLKKEFLSKIHFYKGIVPQTQITK
jgi:hypothetical protein